MFIENFLKYSSKAFCGIWITTCCIAIAFVCVGKYSEIHNLIENGWVGLIGIILLLFICIILPLSFLFFSISIFIYMFKFGIKESFVKFKIYLLEIKSRLISLFKDTKLGFAIIIFSLFLLFLSSGFIIFLYYLWIINR